MDTLGMTKHKIQTPSPLVNSLRRFFVLTRSEVVGLIAAFESQYGRAFKLPVLDLTLLNQVIGWAVQNIDDGEKRGAYSILMRMARKNPQLGTPWIPLSAWDVFLKLDEVLYNTTLPVWPVLAEMIRRQPGLLEDPALLRLVVGTLLMDSLPGIATLGEARQMVRDRLPLTPLTPGAVTKRLCLPSLALERGIGKEVLKSGADDDDWTLPETGMAPVSSPAPEQQVAMAAAEQTMAQQVDPVQNEAVVADDQTGEQATSATSAQHTGEAECADEDRTGPEEEPGTQEEDAATREEVMLDVGTPEVVADPEPGLDGPGVISPVDVTTAQEHPVLAEAPTQPDPAALVEAALVDTTAEPAVAPEPEPDPTAPVPAIDITAADPFALTLDGPGFLAAAETLLTRVKVLEGQVLKAGAPSPVDVVTQVRAMEMEVTAFYVEHTALMATLDPADLDVALKADDRIADILKSI
jgi:hypothetical protein